jgi:uncharacterized protein (TIGR01777 family)
MRILLAGASGFIGTALGDRLRADGHETGRLVRRTPAAPHEIEWDPHRSPLDAGLVDAYDAVVNVAGAPIAHWPWTASYKKTLVASRINTTRALAQAIAASERKPALVNASAIGYFGDRADETLDDDSPPGTDFLARLVQDWEAASTPAADAGARVARIRAGIVLHRDGGLLKLAIVPFWLGLGGRVADGQQWFPTVSLADYLNVASLFVTDSSYSGTYNVVAPVPATNAEFTAALGRHLRRPTILRVPAFAVKAITGNALSQQALGSIRAVPRRLLEAGYVFAHPTVAAQLEAALAPASVRDRG